MAWLRLSLMGIVALTGCARDNPLFGDGAGGSGGGDTGGTSAVTSGDRPGEETSRPGEGSAEGTAGDDNPPITTGADTGPIDPTTPVTSGETGIGSETGIVGTDDGAKVCDVGFEDPFDVHFDGAQPECWSDSVVHFEVVGTFETGFFGVPCAFGSCCIGEPPVANEIEIDLGLELDTFMGWTIDGCVTLDMQRLVIDDFNCELEAYNLRVIADPFGRSLVVSNVVDPTVPEPFNFHLGAPDPADCVTDCGEPAGYRSLAADNGVTPLIPPDGSPTTVDDPNELAVSWDLINVGSGVDGFCEEHGRWIGVAYSEIEPVDPPGDTGVEPPEPGLP